MTMPKITALRSDLAAVKRGVTDIDDDSFCQAHHIHDDTWPKQSTCWTSPLVGRLVAQVEDLLSYLAL